MISELCKSMSCHIVIACSLACKPSCSSSIITFDRCRNKVIFQVLIDNARRKGFCGEESFESIALFCYLFNSSQADCSHVCAVRFAPRYYNEELKKSGYSSEVACLDKEF